MDIMNQIVRDKALVVEQLRGFTRSLADCTALDTEEQSLIDECEILASLMKKAIDENARIEQSQTVFQQRIDELQARAVAPTARLKEIDGIRVERRARQKGLNDFLYWLENAGPVVGFDESLWNAIVESVTVQHDGSLRFRFRDGRESYAP